MNDMNTTTYRSSRYSHWTDAQAAGLSASMTGLEKSEDHKAKLAESLEGRKRPPVAFYTVTFRNGESFTCRGQARTAELVTAFTGIRCNHGLPSHWTTGATIHPRFGIESVTRVEGA